MIGIIENNPFRILGVYANSTKKDMVANKSKATAFLNVNKPVTFPLDLNDLLTPLSRTLAMMSDAEARLSIPCEQLKHTQFWFLKMTPLDDVAFNHLIAGNISKAIEIWDKQDSISSLQNRMICSLVNEDENLIDAVYIAEQLYDEYGDVYLDELGLGDTLQMSREELICQFLDTLREVFSLENLLGYGLGEDWEDYIEGQTIKPLIDEILAEIEQAKSISRNDSEGRKKAGLTLIKNTKKSLESLCNVLNNEDPQYQMIADKLGLEILQCGIDYFNNSDDDDAPYNAMEIQNYASGIVVGSMAKQRVKENVKILQRIIDKLPPKEVMTEDKAIKAELDKFVRLPDKISHAATLLNNTKSSLQSIKRKLGITNAYYLDLSTQVVRNALHNVVEEVNSVQNDPVIATRLKSGLGLDSSTLSRIKKVVDEAWKVTITMDSFDLESSFQIHYNKNRDVLKSMYKQLEISTSESVSTKPSWSTQRTSSVTTTTRVSTQRSNNNSDKEEVNIFVVAIIIHVIWGAVFAFNGGEFLAGMLAGLAGWFVIPINYVVYLIINWIYNKLNE